MLNLFFSLLCTFNLIYWIFILNIIYTKNNLLLVLISVEVAYLMIILLFAITSANNWGVIENQTYCLLLFILAASESAVGLAILIKIYNYNLKTAFSTYQLLHG